MFWVVSTEILELITGIVRSHSWIQSTLANVEWPWQALRNCTRTVIRTAAKQWLNGSLPFSQVLAVKLQGNQHGNVDDNILPKPLRIQILCIYMFFQTLRELSSHESKAQEYCKYFGLPAKTPENAIDCFLSSQLPTFPVVFFHFVHIRSLLVGSGPAHTASRARPRMAEGMGSGPDFCRIHMYDCQVTFFASI